MSANDFQRCAEKAVKNYEEANECEINELDESSSSCWDWYWGFTPSLDQFIHSQCGYQFGNRIESSQKYAGSIHRELVDRTDSFYSQDERPYGYLIAVLFLIVVVVVVILEIKKKLGGPK